MMTLAIRPYHPSDLYMLYQICLRTGDLGQDASGQYHDPELLGHIYAAPYAVLEPDLCFVLTSDGAPCGYVLGARDTIAFNARCEREWFPTLRARYPLPPPDERTPDAQMIRRIHTGYESSDDLADYPAHLHIDILPLGQGQGGGRRLIETFCARLRELGVPAVHLGVGAANTRAIGFYDRVGFHRVKTHERGIIYGMWLASS